LTAGYGLTEDQGFTDLLQRKIDEMVYRYRVENVWRELEPLLLKN